MLPNIYRNIDEIFVAPGQDHRKSIEQNISIVFEQKGCLLIRVTVMPLESDRPSKNWSQTLIPNK